VRLAVASLARGAGFDEERVDDIRIAVSEAATNAVLTNEEASVDEAITVAWRHSDDRAVVEVGDRGGSPALEEATLEDSQGFSSRIVMSVALLRELADELVYEPRDGGGTIARLTFLTTS
jgi:serine/threonine-protein kinase RsbW